MTVLENREDFGLWFLPYYLTIVKINGFISLFLHIIVFYLQIFKTPREMRNYRIYLMNTSVISFLHDLHCSLIWRPVPIFPIIGGYSSGWLRYFDGFISGHLGFIILTILIALYLCSMIAGFVYRIVSLMDRTVHDWFMSRYGFTFVFLFHAIPAIFMAIMLYKSYVPVEAIREKVLLAYPQLREVFKEPIFVYDLDLNPMILYFCGLVVFLIIGALTTIEAFCIGFSIWQLQKAKARLSSRAYRLHFNLCLALGVQMLLPMFMIMYPIIALSIGTIYGIGNLTLLAECALIVCTMHSILDSLVIIFLIRPYRLAILQIITCNSARVFQPIPSSLVFITQQQTKSNATFPTKAFVRTRKSSFY